MALRTKTLVVVGITLISLLVVLYVSLSTILASGFAKVERRDTQENVNRVLDAYRDELNKLDMMVSDYASWNDSYTFIEDHNEAYIQGTLSHEVLARTNLNLVMYIDSSGQVVFETGFDLQTQQATAVPSSLRAQLTTNNFLLQHPDLLNNHVGLLLLPEGPIMIASHPILKSDGTGPPRGTLIMGRYLDTAAIERLSSQTHFTLSAYHVDAPQLPHDFREARTMLEDSPEPFVLPLNADMVAGYTLISDVYGQPGLLMRVQNPRVIYQHGQTSVQYALIALLVVGLVFGVVTLLLLERGILARVARLSEGVSRIGASGNLAVRLQVQGKDELTHLGSSINVMLDALQQAQSDRQESEDRYRAVVEQASEGIFLVDLETQQLLEVNAAFQHLVGYSAQELACCTLQQIVATPERNLDDLQRLKVAKQLHLGEYQYIRPDGSLVDLSVGASVIFREGKQVGCFVVHDLTELKRVEEERTRRKSEERFESLVRNASDVIILHDPDGTIRYHSPSVMSAWGYPPDALNEANIFSLVHEEDRTRAHALVERSLTSPSTNIRTELRINHADGSLHDCEVIANNLLDDLEVASIMVTYRDITVRKRFEHELSHLAFHDSLTGLPNRALLMVRLEHALEQGLRHNRSIAVLFLDLDNFKVINDSLGHQNGDQFLVAVAERIRSCLRTEDTAARLGGDEFTVLLEELADVAPAIDVAERILRQLQAPFLLDGKEVYTTASIGIALSSAECNLPDDLLRDADLAMYKAKTSGKARYEIFDRSMNMNMLRRLELETDMRRAIERNEYVVWYQPVIQLATGRITEVEALIRWQHPRLGLVPPAELIPLAEETGLILQLGKWVMTEACRQVRNWQEAYPSTPPLIANVNLSVRQFQHTMLVEEITEIIRETGINPASLKLEITESVMMHDEKVAVTTLTQLKNLGIQLAIDDFGTGYSSLGYLKSFPIDTLKIDRTFIERLGEDPGDTAIVQTITTLAKTLHLTVTAEGIETASQLVFLRMLDCDQGQGYYFSEALPTEQVNDLLRSGYADAICPINQIEHSDGWSEAETRCLPSTPYATASVLVEEGRTGSVSSVAIRETLVGCGEERSDNGNPSTTISIS